MTVCIAAICQFRGSPLILGASDQMITTGDIEYEQPQPKALMLTPYSVAMFYGNAAAQVTVANLAAAEIARRNATLMADIAQIYADQYAACRRAEAEAYILAPLGLDSETFLVRQGAMAPHLVSSLFDQLQRWQLDTNGGGAILAGVDGQGAHIYQVSDPGVAVCMDRFGFVAAGGGQWHAESQFMFNKYLPGWEFDRALLLVYSAKKRAEVAPGVGEATDMIAITTVPPALFHFGDSHPVIKRLEAIYREGREQTARFVDQQEQAVRQFVEENLAAQPQGPPAPTPPELSGGPEVPDSD